MPVVRTLLALLLCASVSLGADLRLLSGKTITGQLVSANEKEVEFSTAAGSVITPLPQVLDVILQPSRPVAPEVKRIDFELTDGTVLRAKPEGFVVKGNNVELTLLSGQTVKMQLKDIAHCLRDAQDAKLQEKWKGILKGKKKTDWVVLLNQKGEPDALDGTFGDPDEKGETIKFKIADGKTINLRLAKIHGMIFYRPDPNPVPTVCQVYDTGGNVLLASKVTADNAGFKVALVCGPKLEYDKAALTRLDYNIGKLNFLSDLEPVKVVEKSRSGLITRYRKDRNLDDNPIRIDGETFAKGVSLHAYTELEYDLNGKYKEFRAVLGVDDQVGGNSKALVTVECDDTKVFSKEITRKTTIKDFVIKVKDVSKLRIIVSSNNILDLHDHVTFANAKVSQ
jgi:hypothetical protein